MALAYITAEGFFLLVLIRFVISQECSNGTMQQDMYMEHQVFKKFGSLSLYDCATECLTSSVCLSFAFQHKTLTCFLNSNSSAQVSISPRSGFDFSDILPWNKALSGPCAAMSCPVATCCQLDRHGRATSVPEFTGCGRPPDVPFASVTYDGHYKGAVARYTCEKDFTACHERNTSVCQASGEWQNVTALCEKFRWRNTRVNGHYDLPCGPQSNFSVLVLAIPTARTSYSLIMRADANVTFRADFHRTVSGDEVEITTRFSGLFQDFEINVGNESQIQVSLHNGLYKLMVVDIVMELRERQPEMLPDKVSVEGDIRVSILEISM